MDREAQEKDVCKEMGLRVKVLPLAILLESWDEGGFCLHTGKAASLSGHILMPNFEVLILVNAHIIPTTTAISLNMHAQTAPVTPTEFIRGNPTNIQSINPLTEPTRCIRSAPIASKAVPYTARIETSGINMLSSNSRGPLAE